MGQSVIQPCDFFPITPCKNSPKNTSPVFISSSTYLSNTCSRNLNEECLRSHSSSISENFDVIRVDLELLGKVGIAYKMKGESMRLWVEPL